MNDIRFQSRKYATARYGRRAGLPRPHRLTLALGLVLGGLFGMTGAKAAATGEPPGGADIDVANFDPALLRQRGFDPQLADYLKQAPRFTPGANQIGLMVNGARRGKVIAPFDQRGELCIDGVVIEAAALRLAPPAPGACADLVAAYPNAQIELHPESGEVVLVVPADALRPEKQGAPSFARGGVGGLVNYEVFGSNSDFGHLKTDHLIANTELGLNAGNWVIRSRQSYTSTNGVSSFERRDTYGERAILGARSVLQVGDVTMENAVLPGALITGLQLLPESGLTPSSRGAIQGIAQTQARVDVRQNGTLIYSTVVTPGPFSLANLPLIDRISMIDVTVTEADGSERRFSVPAASLDAGTGNEPTGFAASIGRVRDQGYVGSSRPWVASGSGTWALHDRGSVSAAGLVAQSYAAAGGGVQSRWDDWGTTVNAQASYSHASKQHANGGQINVSAQQRVASQFMVNASVLKRSEGYRDLLEGTSSDPVQTASRTDTSWSVGANWASPTLGSIGTAYTRTRSFDHIDYARGTLSWGKQVRGITLSASAEWDLDNAGTTNDDALYFTVSIPLGAPGRRVGGGFNRVGDRDRFSARFEDRPSDTLQYRVTTEHDSRDGATDVRADVSILPRYTQVDLGYSQSTNGDSTTSYGLRGGIALHRNGVTLSPYPIADTFGLVEVGGLPGVKVQTPSGPVWTDWRGQAVIPQLQPYRTSAIELVPRTLPRNASIDNGRQELEVGRGAVQHVIFDVSRARRVLLQAKMPDGTPVPAGATVIDGDKKLVTLVGDGGEIFLIKDPLGQALSVQLPSGALCALQFKLPASADPNANYETVAATCRPGLPNKNELALSQLTAVP